jgi:hypothetical protein
MDVERVDPDGCGEIRRSGAALEGLRNAADRTSFFSLKLPPERSTSSIGAGS